VASWFGFATLASAALGTLAGFFEAIGVAFDGEDFGVVNETVNEGDDAGRIRKDLSPIGEGAI